MAMKINVRPIFTGLGFFLLLCLTAATFAQAAWFDSNYNFKRRIVIQSSQVQGTSHSDFPILITETNLDAAFFTNCQQTDPDNMDIVFTNEAEDAPLFREIGHYDSGNQELEAWVRIPTLSGSTNTVIYMYYGNSSGGLADDTETWVTAFRGVWHMQETPTGSGSDITESTSNNNHGASQNMEATDQQVGKIHGALNFDRNSSEYLDCGNDSSLEITSQVTMSAWVQMANTNDPDAFMRIMSKKSGSGTAAGYACSYSPRDDRFEIYGDWSVNFAYDIFALDTNWHHVVAIIDNTTAYVYLDGAALTMSDSVLTALVTSTQDFLIANQSTTSTRYYDGLLDEVRVIAGVRDADWVATEYANQNTPGSFYQAEAEQPQGTPTFTVTPSHTPTTTPTPTLTSTPTPSPSATQSLTATESETITVTATPTPTYTQTLTATESATFTVTPTITQTSTITLTSTHSPVYTPTITPTRTQTATYTRTPTITPTGTITLTRTITQTPTISPTITVTPTISVTSTITQTLTPVVAAPDLSNVIVYPNPYRAEFYTRNQVTFINLPTQADIRIYALDGRLVRTIRKADPGNRATWNMTNQQNRAVASGVYLYIIQSQAEERRGKILLVR